MDELKKIVDMVADKNYIWVLITTLGKEPLIHTIMENGVCLSFKEI